MHVCGRETLDHAVCSGRPHVLPRQPYLTRCRTGHIDDRQVAGHVGGSGVCACQQLAQFCVLFDLHVNVWGHGC